MTLANAPRWERTRKPVPLICPTGPAKYFCGGLWTGGSKNCPTGKSAGEAAVVRRLRAHTPRRKRAVVLTMNAYAVPRQLASLDAMCQACLIQSWVGPWHDTRKNEG